MFNVLTDEVYNFTVSPVNSSERQQALVHLESLQAGDVVLYDRGNPGWALFWEHQKRGLNFVMRLPTANTWPIVQKFLASGKKEKLVTLPMTTKAHRRYEHDASIPKSLKVRLIRVTLKTGEMEVLATSLLSRKKYPRQELITLYSQRWPIEEGHKSLRCHQAIEKFHAKDMNGIHQEINAHYLLMAIPRLFMLQAATPAPEVYYALSYRSAVNFVSDELVLLVLSHNQKQRNDVLLEVIEMIAHLYEWPRYQRSYPRWSRREGRKYRQRYANPYP